MVICLIKTALIQHYFFQILAINIRDKLNAKLTVVTNIN